MVIFSFFYRWCVRKRMSSDAGQQHPPFPVPHYHPQLQQSSPEQFGGQFGVKPEMMQFFNNQYPAGLAGAAAPVDVPYVSQNSHHGTPNSLASHYSNSLLQPGINSSSSLL